MKQRVTTAMTKFATAAKVAAISAGLAATGAMAQGAGGGLDFSAAANQMKTDATGAVSGVGTIILGIVAALVVLGIVIKVFRKG